MSVPDLGMVLFRLRGKASQEEWAASVGLSGRTISRWKLGERRPTRGQAMELLLKLRDSNRYDATLLVDTARALGLDPREHGIGVAAPAPEPTPRAPEAEVRAKVDAALLDAAEQLDISPRVLRTTVSALLAAIDVAGYSVAELRALVTRVRAD